MVEETAERKLKRHEDALVACMAEIEKQRAENARLRSEADAHTVLKEIYSDPDAPQGNRIKAAQAALSIEKPKLMSVPPPLNLTAEPVIPLADLVTARRARQDLLCPQSTDQGSNLLPVASNRRDGIGNDGDH